MLERLLEGTLYASRWLLAPIYLGLSLALVALGIKFYQEVFHVFMVLNVSDESDLVLISLSLIDMSLVGGLLVMVMLSGYENFVSRIDNKNHDDMPAWLGKLDASSLKLKVAASIVAISSIHLLQKFMDAEHIANDKLLYFMLMHLTFVFSAFLMGILDKVSKAKNADKQS